MAMIKKGTEEATAVEAAKTESGTDAAISRLQKKTEIPAKTAAAPSQGYKPRDFDAEARGKVRCVMFEAALQSPAIAGLPFKDIAGFLALVREAAEAGVAYTWEK